MLEAQAEFVRRTAGHDEPTRGVQAIDVRREIHDAYNREIQRAMADTVWLANCNNYYTHPNGKVVTQFPYSGTTFVEMLARVEPRRIRLHRHRAIRRKEVTACPESTTPR